MPWETDGQLTEFRIILIQGDEERERHIRCNILCTFLANKPVLMWAFNRLPHVHKIFTLVYLFWPDLAPQIRNLLWNFKLNFIDKNYWLFHWSVSTQKYIFHSAPWNLLSTWKLSYYGYLRHLIEPGFVVEQQIEKCWSNNINHHC